MKRVLVVAGLALSLQACARAEPGPSFLGMLQASDEAVAGEPTGSADVHPELRHVDSNKVLGAMAFQKTTGRTIDPSRLQGTR